MRFLLVRLFTKMFLFYTSCAKVSISPGKEKPAQPVAAQVA
jgi:hypothetical protein